MFLQDRLTKVGLNILSRRARRSGNDEDAQLLEWASNNPDALTLVSVGAEEMYVEKAPPVFGGFGNSFLLFLTFLLDNSDEIIALVKKVLEWLESLEEE